MATPVKLERWPATNHSLDKAPPTTEQSVHQQRWKPISDCKPQHLYYLQSNQQLSTEYTLIIKEQLSSRMIKSQSCPSLTISKPSDQQIKKTNTAKSIETMETIRYDTKRIIFTPPEQSNVSAASFLIKNDLNQWFIEDNGERTKIPGIGNFESINCIEIDNDRCAILITGNKNLILIHSTGDNDPLEATDSISDDSDVAEEGLNSSGYDADTEEESFNASSTRISYFSDHSTYSDVSDKRPGIIEGADAILKYSLENSYELFISCMLHNKLIDPDKSLNEDNETLLHTATRFFYPHIIEIMLKNKSVDINKLNNYGESAIIVACKFQENEVEAITEEELNKLINLLLSYHPDGDDCQTALEEAINNRYPLSTINLFHKTEAKLEKLSRELYREINDNPDGDEYFLVIKQLFGRLQGASI